MQLVILLSGHGERFKVAGKNIYKPMIEVNSQGTILERLTNCFPPDWSLHFVLNHLHQGTELESYIRLRYPNSKLHYVKANREGPSRSLLDMIDELDENKPAFISYCDYAHVWDPLEFETYTRATNCDACFVVYKGYHPHYLNPNTYAYCKTEDDKIIDIKEKGSFTYQRENEYASTGGHYIKKAGLLKKALKMQFQNQLIAQGEYYLSLAFQALLKSNQDLDFRIYEVPYFFQLGTPQDLEEYTYWERAFNGVVSSTVVAPAKLDSNLDEKILLNGTFKEGFFLAKSSQLILLDYDDFKKSVINSSVNCVRFCIPKSFISNASFSKILPRRIAVSNNKNLYDMESFWVRKPEQLKSINLNNECMSYELERDFCLRTEESIKQAKYYAQAFKQGKTLTLIEKMI